MQPEYLIEFIFIHIIRSILLLLTRFYVPHNLCVAFNKTNTVTSETFTVTLRDNNRLLFNHFTVSRLFPEHIYVHACVRVFSTFVCSGFVHIKIKQ